MRCIHNGTATARPFVLLALTAGALAGCFRDPDPIVIPDDDLAIHAVLETGLDSAVVLLSRPGDTDAFGRVRGVPGAEVRLIRDADTTWLVEDPTRPCLAFGSTDGSATGCYAGGLAQPLSPGAPVWLEVALPDGTRATGRTVPPLAVTVERPTADARVVVSCGDDETCYARSLHRPPYYRPMAELAVAWEAPPSVERAEVVLRPTAVYSGGDEYPGDACHLGFGGEERGIAGDSTLWELVNVGCGATDALVPARFDSIRAELMVVGWNEEYSRWLDTGYGGGIRVEAASPGIDGAFGVFGAISTSRRTLLLVRE